MIPEIDVQIKPDTVYSKPGRFSKIYMLVNEQENSET